MPILSLAMPTPLRRSFDYLPPAELDAADLAALQPGVRVRAPFSNRQLVGILLAVKEGSDVPPESLKRAEVILDDQPLLPTRLLDLGRWAASYYQHPIGDCLSNALPGLLRKGEALLSETRWQLSNEGKGLPEGALARARKQAELLALLQQQDSIGSAELQAAAISRATLKALIEKGLVQAISTPPSLLRHECQQQEPLPLNAEQQQAVDSVNSQQGYGCFLLEGVTGSGKTEVYLQLIERCITRGQQALLLVPEIGLTPQTLTRFQNRFPEPIALLHSGLTDRERLLSWQAASSGEAAIVIGTRSAVFTPLPNPGLIIVDEEHDSSLKQQDGFRYSARDLCIKRAADSDCPVVLGSATPSLESLNNARAGRYHQLHLNQRATGAPAPRFQLLDIRHQPLDEGLSPELVYKLRETIKAGNQALVFINRRGFAPTLMCHDCGWLAECSHCDARMTSHLQQRLLRCHHCEQQQALPRQCPHCHSDQLDFHGAGTERSEQALQRLFPDIPVHRIDRDTTSRKHAMSDILAEVNHGAPCILVGTQLLAKGHHFADVTLVAILDADGGLFSADFRGPEKMGQQLIQVAGRAGRESKPGTVVIQTHQPDHPLLKLLIEQGYPTFARQLLAERQASGMPPFAHLALLRAEASNMQQPEQLLAELRQSLPANNGAQIFGPLPAPMARRAGRFRAQLLIRSEQRGDLHRCCQQLIASAEQHPLARRLRWSLDIDPIEMF